MPMRIAIVDDEKAFQVIEKEMLKKYLDNGNAIIDCFSNVNSEIIKKLASYDLVLMDIMLTEGDGITFSQLILKENPNIQIIFVSSFSAFMETAYDVPHVWYIMKQKLDTILPKALDRVKENLLQRDKLRIELKNKKSYRYIYCKDVIFIEQQQRKLCFHTPLEVYEEYGRLDEFMEQIPEGAFVRCHKSYAVNIDYVLEYHRTEATMSDGSTVPISRAHLNDLLMAFGESIKKEAGVLE